MSTIDLNYPAPEPRTAGFRELVIIDPKVDHYQILAAGVRPDCEVVILHPEEDGIEQITDLLVGKRHCPVLNAIHIISHGAPGTLYLGNTTLDRHNLHRYATVLKSWSSDSIQNIHLLLYGCQVAAGDVGQAFIEKLHQLTGANIAASSSLVGNGQLGGNWQLDAITGKVETETAFSATAIAAYPTVLSASFGPPTNFGAGTGPSSVAVGDFNGDNILDLAVANRGSGTVPDPDPGNVSVLLGIGDGSFEPKTDFAAGIGPSSVAVGDFNGDNIPDLAVANTVSGNVSVLLGMGDGSFGNKTDFAAGIGPSSVAVGYFNNDNIPDLAVANSGQGPVPSNVSVLLGIGDGSFGNKTDFDTGIGPSSVAVGDFNGDTFLDLAVANIGQVPFFVPDPDPGNVSVLLGDGDGNGGFGNKTDFAAGLGPSFVAVGDFDGDTFLDLAVANTVSGNVSVLLGDGSGGFGTQTDYVTGNAPSSVAVGDFNGDTFLDLALANSLSLPSNVSVFLGDGSGDFGNKTDFAAGIGPSSVAVGDFNGDTFLDLAVANSNDNNVSVLLNTFPIVSISPGTTPTEAGSIAGTFDLTLNVAQTADLTVNYTVTGTATSDNDYTALTGTVTFTAGSTNATFNVVPVDDSIIDTAETVIITLDAGTDYIVDNTADTATLTITDDDTAGITVTPTTGTTTEAGGSTTFDVVLDSEPTADVTITVASSATAEGTVDLPALTFTADNWDTAQTVTVTGVDDTVQDGDISYTITTTATSPDTNYSDLTGTDVTVTNTDDDTPGVTVTPTTGTTTEAGGSTTFDVVLDSQPTADVTISVASSSTAEGTVDLSSLTFTAENWDTAQTVTVTGVDDKVHDGDITYNISTIAASPDTNYSDLTGTDFTVTNTDDEILGVTVSETTLTTEEGETGTFTVVLDSEPTADVTITLTSEDKTEGTLDQSTLTFTADNWDTAQTVTVTGVDDDIDDDDVSYTITTTATSDDANYDGFEVDNVTVTNSDDTDTAGITISETNLTTEEGETGTFTVVLDSEPTAEVTITLTSEDTTEGTLDQSTLTFTADNWDTAQTVTVTGVDDDIDDDDVSYTITTTATSDDANYDGFEVDNVTVTNSDDTDTAGITISETTLTTEEGETGTFTVVLDSEPTADVTITLTSEDTTEGTLDQSTLTFTADNWDTVQTVTVIGVHDDAVDGDVEYTITTSISSDDTTYDGFEVSDITVTTTDVDEPTDDTATDNSLFPVNPSQVTPFTGLGTVEQSTDTNITTDSGTSSTSSTSSTDSTSLPDPPCIPPEPTVDVVNISFTFTGTDGADHIDGEPSDDVITGLDGNDVIRGLQGNDALFGDNGTDEIFGNQGADLLLGNIGDDIIYSGQGNDIAFGGRDNDLIYGDRGGDTLFGDLGDDSVFGGPSNPDLISGDAGDLLFGGDGNDYLQGNVGNDSISGGTGNDTAYGGQGNDLIHGDAGADILYGDKGNDSLTGNADNDVVYGGEGDDFLWGEDGDDFLYGDEGDDTLIGNAGTDYFVIQSGFGSDQVLDFIDGTDLIGLAGGLTFADLSITGINGNTLIATNNELLATLTGVDVSLINSADFTVLV